MGKINLGARYAVTTFAIIGLIFTYLFIIAINNIIYESSISLRFMVVCTLYGLPFLVLAGIINSILVHWANKLAWSKRHEFTSTLIQYFIVITISIIFTTCGFFLFDPNNPPSLSFLFSTTYFPISIITTPILNIIILFVSKYTDQNALLQHQKEQLTQAENEIMKVRYQQLKAQVNPHFLFNTLTVLSTLIKTDQNKAADFTNQLASIYRYLLSTDSNDLVPLTDELAFCSKYIDIISMRYGKGLVIDMPTHSDPAYSHFLIIPTAMQILIENACKHNLISTKHPLHIDINISCVIYTDTNDKNNRELQKQCKITITNNIQPRKVPADSTGLGLKGLKQKYLLLTHRNISISSTSKQFTVSIPLIIKDN